MIPTLIYAVLWKLLLVHTSGDDVVEDRVAISSIILIG